MRYILLCSTLLCSTLSTALPLAAAETPERQRAVGAPQAVGALHTLRQIPEACTRLEGMFTGDAAQPYRFNAVRTSPQCQPRARFVDVAEGRPDAAKGWKLNDVIQVPNAACPSQRAEVRVWRLPVEAGTERDGQGQSRIYLEEARKLAASGKVPGVTRFTAQLQVQGACP